jgi:ribonuclease D
VDVLRASVTPLFLEPPTAITLEATAEPAAAGEPTDATEVAEVVEPAPLLALRDGIPVVIEDAEAMRAAVQTLAGGHGPVAVDAERASSYRYGHRAYLVQLRRAGSGTFLIDPIACPDLSLVGAALHDAEWVLHAANQDLPCLAEIGMVPSALFDTELAGRLAGYPRVGLATMVENLLGWRMEKDHSAADWSRRPLPDPWLRYAALDVEVLLELRDVLDAELLAQGKLEWAREEFEHVRTVPVPAVSVERWRRLSGVHRIRNRRQLAVVRAMWLTRDRLAREADISPTRLLPDASILHVALHAPSSMKALASSAEFVGRGSRRHLPEWWEAVAAATALAEDELPEIARPAVGPPPAHRWAERDRPAAERLAAARAAVAALADEHNVPAENLVQPDAVRRLAWRPPEQATKQSVADALRGFGARDWQIQLIAVPLAKALARAAAHEAAATAAH